MGDAIYRLWSVEHLSSGELEGDGAGLFRGSGLAALDPPLAGGPCYPPLATAILALDRIDSAAGLHWLHYDGKPGAIACRTFMLSRFSGSLFHLDLSGSPQLATSFILKRLIAIPDVQRERDLVTAARRPLRAGQFHRCFRRGTI